MIFVNYHQDLVELVFVQEASDTELSVKSRDYPIVAESRVVEVEINTRGGGRSKHLVPPSNYYRPSMYTSSVACMFSYDVFFGVESRPFVRYHPLVPSVRCLSKEKVRWSDRSKCLARSDRMLQMLLRLFTKGGDGLLKLLDRRSFRTKPLMEIPSELHV